MISKENLTNQTKFVYTNCITLLLNKYVLKTLFSSFEDDDNYYELWVRLTHRFTLSTESSIEIIILKTVFCLIAYYSYELLL